MQRLSRATFIPRGLWLARYTSTACAMPTEAPSPAPGGSHEEPPTRYVIPNLEGRDSWTVEELVALDLEKDPRLSKVGVESAAAGRCAFTSTRSGC